MATNGSATINIRNGYIRAREPALDSNLYLESYTRTLESEKGKRAVVWRRADRETEQGDEQMKQGPYLNSHPNTSLDQ